MESPPSFSTHSEVPPLSEDSGLLITSGSFSSDSASGWQPVTSELQESDFDEQSLSLCESADTSERMCGDFFNTVKKGPGKVVLTAIEPPPEFQDNPVPVVIDSCTAVLVPPPIVVYCNESLCVTKSTSLDISDLPMTTRLSSPIYQRKLKTDRVYERRQCLSHRFANTRLLHSSPCRAARPSSRSSRSSLASRLSTSHNSLVTQLPPDDTGFITQAISHDALHSDPDIADLYNVPFDSDIYALPVDSLRPPPTDANKRTTKERKKRSENASQNNSTNSTRPLSERNSKTRDGRHKDNESKRRSLPASTRSKGVIDSDTDTLRSTLREMRKYFHTLYSSSSDSERKGAVEKRNSAITTNVRESRSKKDGGSQTYTKRLVDSHRGEAINEDVDKGSVSCKLKNEISVLRSANEATASECMEKNENTVGSTRRVKQSPVRMLSMNLKRGLCDLFRWRRRGAGSEEGAGRVAGPGGACSSAPRVSATRRALPPLPNPHAERLVRDHEPLDFPASLRKVKDCGWYWGPISVEVAEKILSNEPDGSFIVRDSSDDHYIFTLTFKLNGLRHVRIEHDQGNFCFSGCTMFKAQTIVEFIEKAVETSRSGRYLFFLNLRPALGPVRVQLLHPVSRLKRVQSLQHSARFVILKCVRRDLLAALPLPRRIIDYLSTTHYYAEIPPDL